MRAWADAVSGARARLGLLVPLAVLAIWVLGFSSRGMFSGDSGVKLAQAHALWDSGFSTRALPYDHDFDPQGRFRPYSDFVRKVDGEYQGIYSVTFTAAAAPLLGAFGLHGTVLLPLLGGLLIGLGTWLALRRAGCHPLTRSAAVAASLLATPVLLYASQFAEHTLAAGLILIALALLIGEPRHGGAVIAAAGALTALAATIRPEGYCAVASVGLAVALRARLPFGVRARECLWYGAGALAVLGAYWALNWSLSGTWDPLVARNAPTGSSWANARIMLVGELRGGNMVSWFLPWAVACAVGVAVAGRLTGAWRMAVHAAVALVVLVAWWQAVRHGTGRTMAGLFAVTPLAAYGLLASVWNDRARPLWLFAVTFIVQVLHLDKSGTAGGLQLGARLLMPALVALVVLAAMTAEADWRSLRRRWASALALAPAGCLLALSIFALARGLPPAHGIAKSGEVSAAQALASPGQVVVTRRWWESQVLAPVVLGEKRIYNIHGDSRPLLERLAGAGVESLVYISRGDTLVRLSGGRVARSVQRWPGWLEVQHVVIERADP